MYLEIGISWTLLVGNSWLEEFSGVKMTTLLGIWRWTVTDKTRSASWGQCAKELECHIIVMIVMGSQSSLWCRLNKKIQIPQLNWSKIQVPPAKINLSGRIIREFRPSWIQGLKWHCRHSYVTPRLLDFLLLWHERKRRWSLIFLPSHLFNSHLTGEESSFFQRSCLREGLWSWLVTCLRWLDLCVR